MGNNSWHWQQANKMVQVKCATEEENKYHCNCNPCVNGRCTGVINDFYCSCEPYWTGKTCANSSKLRNHSDIT